MLAQAIQVGCKDHAAGYLLALAYKRQGKIADARSALRKILNGDANLYLQMGLLSLREKQPAQAEQEFGKAWELDPNSLAAGANLLLSRLSLGQTEWAAALAPQVAEIASRPEDRRLFGLVQALLWCVQSGGGDGDAAANTLAQMSEDDEQRLIQLVRSLGHLDTACLLFRILSASRPDQHMDPGSRISRRYCSRARNCWTVATGLPPSACCPRWPGNATWPRRLMRPCSTCSVAAAA